MREKNYSWHKLAESVQELNFPDSGLLPMEIAGKKICVIQFKDQLFACISKCPHAGGDLVAGYIDAVGNIVCPVHRYKFSVSSGRNSSGEGYFLKTYPVEKREGGLFVGIET